MNSASPNPVPELLDADVLDRARRLNPALLADGLRGLEVPNNGCMDAAILPVDPGSTVVGTALTVDASDGDNFPVHVAIYTATPGYVLVIDGKGHQDCAYLGDLLMSAAQAVGFEGIVIDGLVRDRQGCIELGLPVFSRGFMQNGPDKKRMRDINTPIRCGGVPVRPGDLVVGGPDGVTVVPRDLVDVVLERAELKAEYERGRDEQIAAYRGARDQGGSLPELAPDWVLDVLAASDAPAGAR